RTLAAVATVATAALALSACASGADPASEEGPAPAVSGDVFPLTITHAFGETEIAEAPERVATWGWGSTEAALAVGVHPVTVGEGNYLPWVEQAYEAEGVELPALLTDAEGGASLPYEEFVAADVDLILAPYSGLTEEQYELLSEIAPTVAYPEGPWTTTWDD